MRRVICVGSGALALGALAAVVHPGTGICSDRQVLEKVETSASQQLISEPARHVLYGGQNAGQGMYSISSTSIRVDAIRNAGQAEGAEGTRCSATLLVTYNDPSSRDVSVSEQLNSTYKVVGTNDQVEVISASFSRDHPRPSPGKHGAASDRNTTMRGVTNTTPSQKPSDNR